MSNATRIIPMTITIGKIDHCHSEFLQLPPPVSLLPEELGTSDPAPDVDLAFAGGTKSKKKIIAQYCVILSQGENITFLYFVSQTVAKFTPTSWTFKRK